MNTEQILKLIDAGYTKSEIEAMTEEVTQSAQPEEVKTEEPKTEPEQKEAPAADDRTEKRLEKIESILSQIAANGIAKSEAPNPPEKRNVVKEVLEHL